ncbi:MAG: AMP-binding protein [Phycisphaerae bacterium]|nr:AMP-binding protein [Phycisphaerae bacterium]
MMRAPSRRKTLRSSLVPVCPDGASLFWPPVRWQALQQRLLARHIAYARRSPLYAGRIRKSGTLANLAALPTTSRDELMQAGQRAYACKPETVREWVATSGTTGQPLRVPLTAADLNRLAMNEAVALNIAGIKAGDTLLIAVAFDRMFVAGLAYWLGAQRLGASCVRAGPFYAGDASALLGLAADYQRPFLLTVPSLLTTSLVASAPLPELSAIITIAEPVRRADLSPNALATRLGEHFHAPILSTCAGTETCTTFAEGPQCQGGHLNPRLAVVEILDEAGRPVPDGVTGEVVVTPLGVQGMPLLRFRTGDLAALHTQPCPCGRTTPRLGPIVGRMQQRLKVGGVSLFPGTISEWLQTSADVAEFLVVAQQDFDLSDCITLHVALHRSTEKIRHRLRQQARTILRSPAQIVFTSPQAIRNLQRQSNPRKPASFLDLRPPRV